MLLPSSLSISSTPHIFFLFSYIKMPGFEYTYTLTPFYEGTPKPVIESCLKPANRPYFQPSFQLWHSQSACFTNLWFFTPCKQVWQCLLNVFLNMISSLVTFTCTHCLGLQPGSGHLLGFLTSCRNSKKFQASGLKMKCQSTKLLVGRAGDRKPQGVSESSLVL